MSKSTKILFDVDDDHSSEYQTITVHTLSRLRSVRIGRRDRHDKKRTISNWTSSTTNLEVLPANVDRNQTISITNIRKRDWRFQDDLQMHNRSTASAKPNYRCVPTFDNTLSLRSSM